MTRQELPTRVNGVLGQMGLGNMQLFSVLAEKMKWHQERQTLLAENVANAETPGYRGRDLAADGFAEHMRNLSVAQVSTAATNPAHIVATTTGGSAFGARDSNGFEVTPEGNAVSIEDEMMKVTANQMDYQMVTSLYTRSVKILKTALGRQG